MSRFYITTAIDYPNGAPHIGHAYEKVVTDVYARWHRMLGDETYFLTGTDENGQKLLKAAEAAKVPTKEFVDQNVEAFKQLCACLQISNDDFIRTTEERHRVVVQELWKVLESKGDIYFGQYEGQYCIACENFYPENQAPDQKCPVHGTVLESVKEDGFFFRLSKYAKWITETLKQNPSFVVPASARIEMINRLEGDETKDLSVSRPNQGWGIPVPGHEDHVVYTWFDALINYYSALQDKLATKKFWPASMHVIGKDITWFHAVIWPCMLHAAGIELPKQIYVHGMVLGEDGKKMSKSLGNVVDLPAVLEKYPVDSFRYYILRAIPSGGDGAFVIQDLVKRHNTELGNDYGNLLMRVIKLALSKVGSTYEFQGGESPFSMDALGRAMMAKMESREHHRALEDLFASIGEVNLWFTTAQPWKLDPSDPQLKALLYICLHALHSFATLISPFLPHVGARSFEFLGTTSEGLRGLTFGSQRFQLQTPEALFPRL